MFWLGFFVPLIIVFLLPSLAIIWLSNFLKIKLKPIEKYTPVASLIIYVPISTSLLWYFLKFDLNGYVDCLFLSFISSFALPFYFIAVRLFSKISIGYIALSLSSLAFTASCMYLRSSSNEINPFLIPDSIKSMTN